MGSLLCGVLWLFSVRGNHCPFRRRVRSGGPYEFSRRVDRQLVQPLHPKTTSESIEDRPPSKRGRYCVGASRRSALSNSSTLVLPSYSGSRPGVFVQVCRWSPIVKNSVRGYSPGGYDKSWAAGQRLCRALVSYRCSNDSWGTRGPRLNHKNVG